MFIHILQRFHRKVGQAVQLPSGHVHPLVIPFGKEIHQYDDAQHENRTPEGVYPTAVLTKKIRIDDSRKNDQSHTQNSIHYRKRSWFSFEQPG